MLTQHKYNDILDNWDEERLRDCCKSGKPGDQPCADCCYYTWENELLVVNPAYAQVVEEVAQLQTQLDFISGRRDRYKGWVEELNKAEGLARDICYQLKLIAVQSDKIWQNACKAEQAIEILFCMLRDIYMQLDELKSLYDAVQNCVSRNNDPAVGKDQGILKYLDDYKTKLDAAVKSRDEVIKNIVEAIRLAVLIRNGVSSRDCLTSTEKPFKPCADDQSPCVTVEGQVWYGFKTIICEWYIAFACEKECVPQSASSSGSCPTATADCHSDCELIPTFDFPICNNTFKTDVEGWLAADEAALKDLQHNVNKAKMKREALLACKSSLDLAIKAVDPATRCK